MMSETPELATGRRRSSVYDPARDVFQTTSDALTTVDEEKVDALVAKETLAQGLSAFPKADRRSRSPSSRMTSDTSKKRQRSPSPVSKQRQSNEKAVTSPPEKKRRSSVTEQSPAIDQARVSSKQQTATEPTSTTSTSPQGRPQDRRLPAQHGDTDSENRQNGQTRSRDERLYQSRDARHSERNRNQTVNQPDYRNGDRGQPRRSPESRRNGDRYTPPPRESRTRSPIRRRDPNASARSAYGRRDPPPPRRRSRSPSPIRRSPPREEEAIRRPGGGTGRGRNVLAVAQRLAQERERTQEAQNAQIQRERGVQHMSNQFYNSRPEWVKERGREWRKNESKIKGLRSFNNWIKSCIIQKFSPEEAPQVEELGWGEEPKAPTERKPLLVLDVGCGKGGDLGKWQLAPQTVGLYVGLDPADQSVNQAHDRYEQMRRGRKPIFDARFHVKDCFGEWIGDIPIVKEVGIDPNAGNGGPSKWSAGGFDVVTMMFSMHYAFESEQKARMMLRNVAGSLKKGGRFIGVVPNSDAIAEQVRNWYQKSSTTTQEDSEKVNKNHHVGEDHHPPSFITTKPPSPTSVSPTRHPPPPPPPHSDPSSSSSSSAPTWGNSIYTVRFTPPTTSSSERTIPPTGIFRDPPFGWKYMYWMSEAVDVPEYVVPWEAFRALAEGFNLEQRYRKPFLEIWEAEKDAGEMRELSFRMGVRRRIGGGGVGEEGRGGQKGDDDDDDDDGLAITGEEREAVGFYHAFCFVKV